MNNRNQMCKCGHDKSQHYHGRGSCDVIVYNGACGCRRFRKPTKDMLAIGHGQRDEVKAMTPTPTKFNTALEQDVKSNPTPTKKEWCGHIVLSRHNDPDWPYWLTDKAGDYVLYVPDYWTRCPICGKERPKG